MCKEYRNIYQIARNAKGITQEKASELLNVSIESLRAYESSRTPVPNQVAADMTMIYGVEHLAMQHIRENPVGKMVFPSFSENVDCSKAILNLLKEVNDVVQCRDELISIGADGIIDESERASFERIIKELDELKTAIMELQYSKKA